MEAKEILNFYTRSELIKSISEAVSTQKTIRLKGMAGSYDALVGAATSSINQKTNIDFAPRSNK